MRAASIPAGPAPTTMMFFSPSAGSGSNQTGKLRFVLSLVFCGLKLYYRHATGGSEE